MYTGLYAITNDQTLRSINADYDSSSINTLILLESHKKENVWDVHYFEKDSVIESIVLDLKTRKPLIVIANDPKAILTMDLVQTYVDRIDWVYEMKLMDCI